MNAELIEDLKRFIDSRFSQQEARFDEKLNELRDELRTEFRSEIGGLRTEVRDGFAGVADAMEENNKHVDERLTALEEKVA